MLAPGCYDALSARLVEEAGFPAAYMTGFGSSAGYLGRPDVGLMTMDEMVGNARRIVDAVGIPVIADADTGYGNPINVIRAVQAYERAGVDAIHIEDQVAPKKARSNVASPGPVVTNETTNAPAPTTATRRPLTSGTAIAMRRSPSTSDIRSMRKHSLVSLRPLSSDRKYVSRPPSTPPRPKRKHQRDGRRHCDEHQLRV